MTDLESLLARQLRKAGHPDPNFAPSDEIWKKILKRVSDHYRHMKEDREMLVRSLELLTAEMTEAAGGQQVDRSQVAKLVGSVAEALGALSTASGLEDFSEEEVEDATRQLEGAEAAFLEELRKVEPSTAGDTPEVESLRRHFVILSDLLKRSLEERARHRAVMREVERASSVQRLLMPERAELERPFLQLAAYAQAAGDCSGDWWTVHDLPDGRILLVLGDVTGHGLSAGIITGAAKASCDVARTMFGEKLSSSSLLRVMNCGIEGATRQELLMTCVAAIFDPHERSLSLANAGHVLPYLVRREGDRGKVTHLRTHGSPLGVTRDATYTSVEVALEENDILLFHTDGLIEREGPTHEQFGRKRLTAVLEQSVSFSAAGIRDAVLHSLARHAEETPADDDVTFVVARFGETG